MHVMCYHPMAAYQCLFDPNIIFYMKDDLVLHCKQNHVLCKLCDTMSVNQASLEEHYRKDIPNHHHQRYNQQPPAVQVQQMSWNQNRLNQAKRTKPKHNCNHIQTSRPRGSRQTFALFVAQPASTLVTYARNHLEQWQISGCTLIYTARCPASFVTGSSSMPAAWMNT